MPVQLTPGDRKLLTVMAIVLAVMVASVAFLSPASEKETGIPSSYSASSGGAKAAYLLLKESGYQVQRWEQSPLELPEKSEGVLLVLADPVVAPRGEERFALHRFLEGGGRVLCTGMCPKLIPESEANALPEAIEWKTFQAQLPSRHTRRAGEIRMRGGAYWAMRRTGHLPLYGGDEGIVAVSYRVGKGEVTWWASATPLTNAGISQSGNLEFFLDSIGEPQTVRVLWDEYFHGQQQSLWALAATTPVPYALAQLGFFGLMVVVTFSRRNGPVRLPEVESRLSALEFVETLGALYRKARAPSIAVQIALARLRFVASRRFGLPARASREEVARAAAERAGSDHDAFLKVLREAEAGSHDPELTDTRGLELVRRLHAQAEALRQRPERKAAGDGNSEPTDGARTRRVEQDHRRAATAAR